MTHDERISSYIDNELSADQEQEFLISLAASDGLRKSFRSELVLKKVLHRDESVTAPSHRLRAAVFTTLGLGAAGLTAGKANAAQSAPAHGLIKSFFATKMSTLVTAAGLSLSAVAGYGVHSLVSPTVSEHASHPAVHAMKSGQVTSPQVSEIAPVASEQPKEIALSHPAKVHHVLAAKSHQQAPAKIDADKNAASGTAGGGPITMEPPKVNQH